MNTPATETPKRWLPGANPGTIALIVILAHVVIISSVLFPPLSQIGSWDEALYVNWGRRVISGELPNLSLNPLVGAIYALAYLPVQASAHWLAYTCSLGRIIFIVLLWIAAYQVARALRDRAHPLILVGLVAVSPVLAPLLDNGTNSLFTSMSGLALAQLLGFERTGRLGHLWRASLFVGLAALSRNEGPVLFTIFVVLGFAICVRNRIVWKGLPAVVVPFMILVGGYVGLRGVVTGNWVLGTSKRSYFTFEQGHGLAFAESYGGKQFYVEGEVDAARLFGSAEENNNSILKAIRRNPTAYLQRIPRLTKLAAKDAFYGYGRYFALFCSLFAVRGMIELLRRREFLLAAILPCWGGYAVLYALLCFQPHHLLMPFLSLLTLTAVGISAFTGNLASQRERLIWSVGLLALAVGAAIALKLSSTVVPAALVLLLVLWAIWLVADMTHDQDHASIVGSFALPAVGLLLTIGPVFRPALPPQGDPDEKAVAFLASRFEPGTRVAAWAPGMVWAARMEPVTIGPPLRTLRTAGDVAAWMNSENIAAIYVDEELNRYEGETLALIDTCLGNGLEIGFHGGEGGVRILVSTSGR